ncbi:putative YccA/Bax inhibitor family protein [Mycetocola sp. CAN_C7]|uniref:Bax inhibitor-1/YccA family protein n=1 Tax=Mycetocola sp. CAN_C7 TaxID=2787724 RepID=UPI0018CB695E
MAMNNPAFNNPAFAQQGAQVLAHRTATASELDDIYNRPAVQADRMTVEDTVMKSAIAFGVLIVGAIAGWFVGATMPALVFGAAIIGFVLALVNIFKKEPSAPLILAYAAAQGIFVGGISYIFEQTAPGIVIQAVLATLTVVGVTLALFASGKIRASKKATKVFMIAMVGYLVFSLINVGMQMFGLTDNAFGLRSELVFGIPLGVILGILCVVLGAYSLVLDFDFIQKGVQNKAQRKYGWTGAFGIMVTVIWLYLEILRMLAIARD